MLRPVGFFCFLLVVFSAGCYSFGEMQRPDGGDYEDNPVIREYKKNGTAFVKFDVKPVSLEQVSIYLDESYYGRLASWKDGIVKMPAGHRKIKLEAPGFFPQRFDFELADNSQSTFTITLEPLPEEVDNDGSQVRFTR